MRPEIDAGPTNGSRAQTSLEPAADLDREAIITAAVAEIVGRRAAIEQAKGMLMCVYGIDADAAFDLLRWQSQHHNVKLRVMAERVSQDFREASDQQVPTRRTYDELLVTAHTRIGATPLANVVEDISQRITIVDSADG